MVNYRRRRRKPRRHLVHKYYSSRRKCWIKGHFRGRKKRRRR